MCPCEDMFPGLVSTGSALANWSLSWRHVRYPLKDLLLPRSPDDGEGRGGAAAAGGVGAGPSWGECATPLSIIMHLLGVLTVPRVEEDSLLPLRITVVLPCVGGQEHSHQVPGEALHTAEPGGCAGAHHGGGR